MPFTPKSKNLSIVQRLKDARVNSRREEIVNGEALHRTAPAEVSGTPKVGMGDQNEEGNPFVSG